MKYRLDSIPHEWELVEVQKVARLDGWRGIFRIPLSIELPECKGVKYYPNYLNFQGDVESYTAIVPLKAHSAKQCLSLIAPARVPTLRVPKISTVDDLYNFYKELSHTPEIYSFRLDYKVKWSNFGFRAHFSLWSDKDPKWKGMKIEGRPCPRLYYISVPVTLGFGLWYHYIVRSNRWVAKQNNWG